MKKLIAMLLLSSCTSPSIDYTYERIPQIIPEPDFSILMHSCLGSGYSATECVCHVFEYQRLFGKWDVTTFVNNFNSIAIPCSKPQEM